jgi:hypothetical protein
MATATEPTVLDGLKDQRAKISADWDTLIEDRETARQEFEARLNDEDETKHPTDEERDAYNQAEEEFRTNSKSFEDEYGQFNERILTLEGKAERRKVAEEHSVTVEKVTEPQVYRADNAHDISYFRDLIGTERSLRGRYQPEGGWGAAEERLRKHGKMMEEVVEVREAKAKRDAEIQIEQAEGEFRSDMGIRQRGFEASPFEKRALENRANPSRQPGAGGEFVPPLWLVENDFIPALRASRVISNLCRNMPVPPGTDVVKLPKIKLGAEVAPQLADNAGVASRDIETETVEAPIKTLAGQEDVAIQLIEQSPGQVFDRVVQEDLLADYHLKVDQNVSYGQGLNFTSLNAGTIRGLFPGTGWGAGHRESTKAISPQVLIGAMGANWSHIAKERFSTEGVHHVINPAFGAFLASATDGATETGRLVINAESIPNFNTSGLTPPVNPAEGYFMKTTLGPDVYISPNVPPVLPQAQSGTPASILAASNKAATEVISAGTEAFSYLLSAKFDDVWFFESDLRVRVLPEVLSGTLQIRFQVYAYIGLLVRYGPSLQFAGGTPFKVGTSFGAAPTEPALAGYAY